MANSNNQIMLNHDNVTHGAITTATDSPLLDIELLSPSISFSSDKESSFSASQSFDNRFDAGVDSGNHTDDLLALSSPQAPFAFTGWGWTTSNGSIVVDFTRSRARSDSLVAADGDATTFEAYFPQIPETVPEILPSLYSGSDAGVDEDDEEEDELTETYSGFSSGQAGFDGVHISTFHSLPMVSEIIIALPMEENDSPDIFEEVDTIIATVRTVDDGSTETI